MTDILLKRAEAARQLGVSERTIKRMDTCGQLQKVTLSPRIVRYRQSDIDAIKSSGGRDGFSRYDMLSTLRVQSFSRRVVGDKRLDVARSGTKSKD